MTTRVALLRGINLAGHKKIAMAELRRLADEIGLVEPRTYVQSGNLVFETDLDETETVQALESAMSDRFGFDVPVISRSGEEIEDIAGSHPFTDLGLDHRMMHVAFLDRPPADPIEEVIEAIAFEPDVFSGDGREVYLAYPKGSGRSKLDHALLERRLGVSVTLRNWRTVTKLAEMVAESSA